MEKTFVCENCFRVIYDRCDCDNPKLISIDEDLAPFISKLWQLGIQTSFCCSGHLLQKKKNLEIAFDDGIYITFKFKNEEMAISFIVELEKLGLKSKFMGQYHRDEKFFKLDLSGNPIVILRAIKSKTLIEYFQNKSEFLLAINQIIDHYKLL